MLYRTKRAMILKLRIIWVYFLWRLGIDIDSINALADNSTGDKFFIHNDLDGNIADPGDGWKYVMASELAENDIIIFEYNN